MLLSVDLFEILKGYFRSHCVEHTIIDVHSSCRCLFQDLLAGLASDVMPVAIDVSNPVHSILGQSFSIFFNRACINKLFQKILFTSLLHMAIRGVQVLGYLRFHKPDNEIHAVQFCD